MAAGYFISYAANNASNCQTTGSTQIFLTNSSASFVNPDPGGDIFWSSPNVGDNWENQPNLIIAYAAASVQSTLPSPYGEEARANVTFWGLDYSDAQVGYLELMNNILVQLALPTEANIASALSRLKTGGAWTNYDTDIPAFQLSVG
jgi:hypothetical protein